MIGDASVTFARKDNGWLITTVDESGVYDRVVEDYPRRVYGVLQEPNVIIQDKSGTEWVVKVRRTR